MLGRPETDGTQAFDEDEYDWTILWPSRGGPAAAQHERCGAFQYEPRGAAGEERKGEAPDLWRGAPHDERAEAARDGRDGVSPSPQPSPVKGEGVHRVRWVEPVRFAHDALGVSLWWKQQEVLNAVMRHRRVAVKSGNGLGKDFTAAVAVLWYVHCHDPAIVLSTAPTFRQVRHVLWRQIHRLHRGAVEELGGKMLDTRWELAEDRYALGLSAAGADQFQGFHCRNVFVVVDEAEGVDEEIYEAIDSVMTSENPTLLLIGNPTVTAGPFHRAFHQESGIYHTITISALESPNVQRGQVEIPGLTTAAWVEERRIVWGEDSDRYRARVLGQFPRRGEDNLIAMDDIEAAVYENAASLQAGETWGEGDRPARDRRLLDAHASGEGAGSEPAAANPSRSPSSQGGILLQAQDGRTPERDPFGMFLPQFRAALDPAAVVIGVDVARFGSDRTVVLVRRGDAVVSIRAFERIDTMAATGEVMAEVRVHKPDRVNVDTIGVGGGLADRLREQGIPVRDVNVSENPWRDGTCANLRAEGYQSLARRFRESRIRIPRDAELISELATLRYGYDSRGRLIMESKERMKKRGSRSPDKADALMLAFLEDASDDHVW